MRMRIRHRAKRIAPRLAALCVSLLCGWATDPAAADDAASVFELPGPVAAECPIDKIVFAELQRLKIEPVLCSDAVFVRRVYLDVTGTLPSAGEVRQFLMDADSANKRRHLIDRLLERPEHADYWAMKWSDILRIKAEFPVNLWPNAAQAYHRWVRASLAENKPYHVFVRELLTASGSNFRVGPVNFFRAIQNRTPVGIAGAVSLTFMGARADSWPKGRLDDMAVFFSQVGYKPTSEWKEELVFWDPLGTAKTPGNTAPGKPSVAAIGQPPPPPPAAAPAKTDTDAKKPAKEEAKPAALATGTAMRPLRTAFPDGVKVEIPPDKDPREVFADWMVSPRNAWFTRCAVNRAWAWLLGRGIVHEPDDIRTGNMPSNPALLAHLNAEFIASRCDMRQLCRQILNSKTYQLSSLPRHTSPEAAAQFASYPLRRLEAEVLIDAISKVTGTFDLYTSPIPEPFTYIPRGMSAVSIADGSITSPFLALFGRSARATGMENERSNKPLPAQWLHLLNSSHIQSKLEKGPALAALIDGKRKASETVEELYLAILSRFPTQAELAVAMERTASDGGGSPQRRRREEWIDLAWALINSSEFLFRH
jgi:hypothetical protein